jgi:hypothetical protein
MRDNLDTFTECVRNAPTNKKAEEFVRMMLVKFAKNCPMHVLVQLGQCVIDCRKSELRHEAEQN